MRELGPTRSGGTGSNAPAQPAPSIPDFSFPIPDFIATIVRKGF